MILCNNEAFDVFFNAPLGFANVQGNGPRGNLNIDLKSKDIIWATKDIFAKKPLVTCKGTILEFTLHGFTLFMLEKVASVIFLIGSKKHATLINGRGFNGSMNVVSSIP